MMHRLAYPRVSLTGRQLSEEAARYPAQRDATCSAGELAEQAWRQAVARSPAADSPRMLVPDPLTKLAAEHAALLGELDQARLTIATLGQVNEGLMAANLRLRVVLNENARRNAIDVKVAKARLAEMAGFIDPAVQPVREPPTHKEPVPLRALSQRSQAIGLLVR